MKNIFIISITSLSISAFIYKQARTNFYEKTITDKKVILIIKMILFLFHIYIYIYIYILSYLLY